MIYNNILEAIGNTPLIKLNHIVPEGAADVYVKNEGLGLVDIEDANKSLEKHGIDLRLERW